MVYSSRIEDGTYIIEGPSLTGEEELVYNELVSLLRGDISLSDVEYADREVLEDVIGELSLLARQLILEEEVLSNVVSLLSLAVNVRKVVVEKAVIDTLSLGPLYLLLRDPEIEEVMINGMEEPVHVFHRKYGMMETNIIPDERDIEELVRKLERMASKRVTDSDPFLDYHLSQEIRVNVTHHSLSPKGWTVTLRKKVGGNLLSILDIVRLGTLSTDMAAYLWLAVEGLGVFPQNVLVAGNTGGGKTTTLNALFDFIPHSERIITIEDTRELFPYGKKNWIPFVSNNSVTMDDILRNALRMRPDRLVIGEVRGKEARTLFTAMNVGHTGTLGTLHANSGWDAVSRLTSYPMNVPRDLIPLLDVIVVQHRIQRGRKVIRRVVEIVELGRGGEGVNMASVYVWDPQEDVHKRTGVPIYLLEKLAGALNIKKKLIMEEQKRRRDLLESLLKKEVKREELPRILEESGDTLWK